MDRKIRLLQTLRTKSAEMATYCREHGEIEGFKIAMERANAYASAMYMLFDEEFFESMCKIWNIK